MNWSHSILGWFSTDFRKLKILSQHLLPQSRVREFVGKQVSEQPRYWAGLIPHRISCPWVWLLLPDLAPTGFSEWDLGCILHAWNSSLYSILAGSPWFYLLHSAFMWVGDVLGNGVSGKMRGLLQIRESIQFHEHSHGDAVNLG